MYNLHCTYTYEKSCSFYIAYSENWTRLLGHKVFKTVSILYFFWQLSFRAINDGYIDIALLLGEFKVSAYQPNNYS